MYRTLFVNNKSKHRFIPAPILALIAGLAAGLPADSAEGASPAGNILVANGSRITEYAANGDPARVIDIEPRDGQESVLARDVVVDRYGRIHVMTFSPGSFMASEQAYLSTYDPAAGTWQHNTIEGWSLASVTYYGGIAVNDNYLYAPDQQTGGGDRDGIIRFPLDDLASPERFHEIDGTGYHLWHSITAGLDGYMYALERGSTVGELQRFDPVTMELLDRFPVYHGASVMSAAVAADGEIFTVDLHGTIYRHDADGVLLDSAEDTGGVDMELFPDGTIVVGSTGTTVTRTDRSLDALSTFEVPHGSGVFDVNFVTFASRGSSFLPGDVNQDGFVGGADLDLLRANWGATVTPSTSGDANGDGAVNGADLDIVRANWGMSAAAVPEPSVAIPLLAGVVLLVGPKRRARTPLSRNPL